MAVSENGIKKMAENNIIAILLPGTTFSLGKTSFAPYNSLRGAGIDIAIATDFNPGSCFIKSMPFIISLCCIYLKMPIYEAIKASTYTAAKSLGLENEIGSIEKEKKADLIIWNIKDASQIPFHFLDNPISKVMKNGELLFTA
jgi:imidazolonepropionase